MFLCKYSMRLRRKPHVRCGLYQRYNCTKGTKKAGYALKGKGMLCFS